MLRRLVDALLGVDARLLQRAQRRAHRARVAARSRVEQRRAAPREARRVRREELHLRGEKAREVRALYATRMALGSPRGSPLPLGARASAPWLLRGMASALEAEMMLRGGRAGEP